MGIDNVGLWLGVYGVLAFVTAAGMYAARYRYESDRMPAKDFDDRELLVAEALWFGLRWGVVWPVTWLVWLVIVSWVLLVTGSERLESKKRAGPS